MNKKFIIAIIAVLTFFLTTAILSSLKNCRLEVEENMITQNTRQGLVSRESLKNTVEMPKNDIVQIYLFHSTQRCRTCIAIGRLAEDTINEFYQAELQEGKIEFREINIDLPENQALAKKFQASGSSLFINNYNEGKDHITENIKVWRLANNEAEFKNYFKDELDKLLRK